MGRTLLSASVLLPAVLAAPAFVAREPAETLGAPARPSPPPRERVDLEDGEPPAGRELPTGFPVEVLAASTRAVDLLRAGVYAAAEEESGALKLEETTFGTRVRRGRVTVVLVWSTRCKECRRLWELPAVMEDAGIRHVEHVSVRIDSLDHPLNAWSALQAEKVSLARANVLVDIETNAARSAFMRAIQASVEPEKVVAPPIVLVFDCRRALRLYHLGVLDTMGLDDLSRRVSALAVEVGTERCQAVAPKKPMTAVDLPLLPVPKAPECGDAKCDLGEVSTSCCDCRGCQEGQICVGGEQWGRETRCVQDYAPKGPFR